MESNQDDQQQSGQPSPQDVKSSVENKSSAKAKAEQVATVKKAVAKQSKRQWGFFGARSGSNACEYWMQGFELAGLRFKLEQEAAILEEFQLTPEELGAMTSD